MQTYDDLILKSLHSIKDGNHNKAGICFNLEVAVLHNFQDDYAKQSRVMRYIDGQFDLAVVTWPEFSGDFAYPVPHPEGGGQRAAYVWLDRWSGEYGASRMRLLDHLIEYFSNRIASEA